MKSPIRVFISLVLLLASSFTVAQDCNRQCLTRFLDEYLNSIVAHQPQKAPLSHGFRQTENAIATANGEGLWKSVTALGKLQRRYLDPVAGTAGYFGTVDENGEPAAVALRLKISANKITEAEWHIGRKGDVGLRGEPGKVVFNYDNLLANPPAEGTVLVKQRYSRDDLIAIANSYFDGITNADAKLVKGHPGCSRLENGFPTYGQALTSDDQLGHEGKVDCRTQGDFGIALVAARRTQVVDVEQQVVLMSAVFIRKPGVDKWRNHFTEAFSIKDGLIQSVHAAMFYAEPTQPVPNWPPYEGNFPLPN